MMDLISNISLSCKANQSSNRSHPSPLLHLGQLQYAAHTHTHRVKLKLTPTLVEAKPSPQKTQEAQNRASFSCVEFKYFLAMAAASSSSLFFGSSVSPAGNSCSAGPNTAARPAVMCSLPSAGVKRREAITRLASTLLAAGLVLSSDSAKATLVEDLLAKSAANKELNDKKRLATSYANIARAYTVANGTCKFPENFTGCQDLAKKKNVPFLSDDLKLECEGKEKFKCGSNVFWKW